MLSLFHSVNFQLIFSEGESNATTCTWQVGGAVVSSREFTAGVQGGNVFNTKGWIQDILQIHT